MKGLPRHSSHYLLGTALALMLQSVAASAQGAPNGRYECWYFTSPRPLYNFSLPGGGVYIDAEGHRGTVKVSGNQIDFSGGNLDGLHAVYTGGNPANISFRDAQGAERFFCQRVGA